MNAFRHTPDKSLDREYLRICAVYRVFVRQGRINKARAIELLEQRKVKFARALVELWMTNPRGCFAKAEGR